MTNGKNDAEPLTVKIIRGIIGNNSQVTYKSVVNRLDLKFDS